MRTTQSKTVINLNASGGHSAAWTLGLCYLIALFEGIDLQAAGVAAPRLGPALGLGPEQLGWFFASSTFGLILGALLGGRLSDRVGRKRVLIVSVVVFGLMSVATALASGLHGLLMSRFLTGFGIGGALPNLVALTSENAPAGRKSAHLGLLYAGLPSGGALASLISTFGSAHDWRTIFLVGGLAPLLTVPLLIWLLPESSQLKALRRSEPLAAGGTGFLFALFSERRALLTVWLAVGFFLALLTMYLLLNWLPTLLVSKGLSRPDASWVQLSFNVFGALASVATGALMQRLSFSLVVAVAFLLSALSLLLLAYAPPALSASIIAGGLVGATLSATQTLIYAVASVTYPTAVRGTGVGTAVCIGRLGSAAGPLLAASLIRSGQAPQQVLALLAPLIVLSGLAIFALVRRLGANDAITALGRPPLRPGGDAITLRKPGNAANRSRGEP